LAGYSWEGWQVLESADLFEGEETGGECFGVGVETGGGVGPEEVVEGEPDTVTAWGYVSEGEALLDGDEIGAECGVDEVAALAFCRRVGEARVRGRVEIPGRDVE
jgi:hypothetical protein